MILIINTKFNLTDNIRDGLIAVLFIWQNAVLATGQGAVYTGSTIKTSGKRLAQNDANDCDKR